MLLSYFATIQTKTLCNLIWNNTATQEDKQHDSIDKKTESELKCFFAKENLNAKTV